MGTGACALYFFAVANARPRSTNSREDSACQILMSGPTSQSRDWRTCGHGDVAHTSQYQSWSRATTSRVVCGGRYINFVLCMFTEEDGKESASDEVVNHKETKPESVQNSMDSYLSVLDKIAEEKRLEDFPTFCAVWKSPMFILMTAWTINVQGFVIFVIGIANPWLTWLADGDKETGGELLILDLFATIKKKLLVICDLYAIN